MDGPLTRLVHCQKAPYDFYMGRPGPYGNPWSYKKDSQAQYTVDTLDEALENYRNWFYLPEQEEFRLHILETLAGKTLGCWCLNKTKCHVGIIIDFINKNMDNSRGINKFIGNSSK